MLFVVFVVLLYLACAVLCAVAPKNGAKSGFQLMRAKLQHTTNDVMNQPMQGILLRDPIQQVKG